MKKIYAFLLILVTLFIGQHILAQTFTENFKSLPVPYLNNAGDEYGKSISVDGDYAVVGAPGYKNSQGCAYVLHYSGTSWEYIALLSANNGTKGDNFGNSVSISGSTIVIGANGVDSAAGAAYIFEKPLSGWTDMKELAELNISNDLKGSNFGFSVDIYINVIIVGAYGRVDGGIDPGHAYIFVKPANGWHNMTQTAKLAASDPSAGSRFGYSVSIYDDVAIVGAYQDSEKGAAAGSAYVYQKPASGWVDMTQTAKLTASDGGNFASFGESVCIYGDLIVAGASGDDDNGSYSGAAYVFEKPTNGWANMTQTAKLKASDAIHNNYLGSAVTISSDVIVVGADYFSSAYVYIRPVSGWADMTQTAKLKPSVGVKGEQFGNSICISGDMIVVGANRDDINGYFSGSVYVFKKGPGIWANASETQKTSSPIQYLNNSLEEYGKSVSVDGNYAVVGAPQYNKRQGCAYVLKYSGSSWVTIAVLKASDGENGDIFGTSVGISGNVIVVGASDDGDGACSGSAYLFEKPTGEWKDMTQTAKLTASDGTNYDYFGCSVSISGNVLIIGAYYDDNGKGTAYVFEKPANGWATMTQTAKLTASDRTDGDFFGSKVGIFGNVIVIGAERDDNIGSVYVFEKPAIGWINMTQTAKLTSSDGVLYDNFGSSISISGELIVVGANAANYNGTAYVYKKTGIAWTDMTQTAKLVASDGATYDNFGCSVSISGDLIVVGAEADQDKGFSTGAAYVFKKPEGGWVNMNQSTKIGYSEASSNKRFGCSVSISGNLVVVGASENRNSSKESGSAYLFQLCYLNDSESPSLTCIANQIKSLDSGQSIYKVSGNELDLSASSDNCRVAKIVNDYNSKATLNGESLPKGITSIKWTISDFAGNQATCSYNVTVNPATGLNELENSGVLIYPNPTSEKLTIEFGSIKVERIEIIDLSGKTILEKTKIQANESLDLSNFENGIYIINIQSGKRVIRTKIIKE